MTLALTRRQVLAGAAALAATPWAGAESGWPARNITLMHGFGAGGNADVVARLVAEKLQAALGKPMIVDIKSGAGGMIASDTVAKSPADGHTLVLLTGAHTVSAAMRRRLPYDPVRDFAFVSTVNTFPFVVAVRAEHPAQTLADLLARAKAEPGKVNFSSVGVGSTQHLVGELLASTGGAPMTHIPYRGGGATVQAVLAGDVDLLVDTPTVALPHLQAGKLRALGVTSAKAWPTLPGVLPVADALPGFEVRSWLGLAAPAGTPAPVTRRLNEELARILATSEVEAALARVGSVPAHGTPQAMQDMIQNDIARWRSVIARANIPVLE
jgi:tripartite-type tricarboxylate transporter receptor subunit TctC